MVLGGWWLGCFRLLVCDYGGWCFGVVDCRSCEFLIVLVPG